MFKIPYQRWSIIYFGLYICLVLYAVFFQYASKSISKENIDNYLNFIPIKNTFNDILFLFENGIKGNMNLVSNIFGNILLFLPLAFFLIRLFKIQEIKTILLIGFLLSLWIEITQYLFILGVSDIDDILLNVLGTYLGFLFVDKVKMKIFNK